MASFKIKALQSRFQPVDCIVVVIRGSDFLIGCTLQGVPVKGDMISYQLGAKTYTAKVRDVVANIVPGLPPTAVAR